MPDPTSPNLGTPSAPAPSACRRTPSPSPSASVPLAAHAPAAGRDPYLSGVFKQAVPYQKGAPASHEGYYQALHERAELCASCHDVTNPLTIKNRLGRWVGGFPIERTYAEWAPAATPTGRATPTSIPASSATARPATCSRTTASRARRRPSTRTASPCRPRTGRVADDAPERAPAFSHHFVGGNAFMPRVIGADVDSGGAVAALSRAVGLQLLLGGREEPLPQRLVRTNVDGPRRPSPSTPRLAWDRLRNVLSLTSRARPRPPPAAAPRCASPWPTPAAATTSLPVSPRAASPGWRCAPTTSPPAASSTSTMRTGSAPPWGSAI